jgi:hypothetical protein
LSAREDIVGHLYANPGSSHGYTFRAFLLDREPERFERDYALFVEELAPNLDAEQSSRFKAAAHVTWLRVQIEREEQRRAVLTQVAERWSAFAPHEYGAWEYSGRIHYGAGLTQDRFTEADLKILRDLGYGVGVREGRVAVNTALHAHLARGSHGVSFAYVVADDGKIDTLVYAEARKRIEDQYVWSGGRAVPGPETLDMVSNDPMLVKSRRLVTGLAEHRAGAAKQARDVERRVTQLREQAGPAGLPELTRLTEGFAAVHKEARATPGALRDPAPQAPKSAKKSAGKAKAKVGPAAAQTQDTAVQQLRRLGVDTTAGAPVGGGDVTVMMADASEATTNGWRAVIADAMLRGDMRTAQRVSDAMAGQAGPAVSAQGAASPAYFTNFEPTPVAPTDAGVPDGIGSGTRKHSIVAAAPPAYFTNLETTPVVASDAGVSTDILGWQDASPPDGEPGLGAKS